MHLIRTSSQQRTSWKGLFTAPVIAARLLHHLKHFFGDLVSHLGVKTDMFDKIRNAKLFLNKKALVIERVGNRQAEVRCI